MSRTENKVYILNNTMDDACLYELLAEEASELSQAALKLARVMRGEVPTPTTAQDANEHLMEEFNDVLIIAEIVSLARDNARIDAKMERWVERLKERRDMDSTEV